MNKKQILYTGLGLGAGLMYVLDPDRGRRRRALVRDMATHLVHTTDDALGTTWRDVRNRMRGLAAEATTLFTRETVSDEVLVERVRARLGRVVSHPHAIAVTAEHGRVTLRGPIFAHEVDPLLKCVYTVRGVAGVAVAAEGVGPLAPQLRQAVVGPALFGLLFRGLARVIGKPTAIRFN